MAAPLEHAAHALPCCACLAAAWEMGGNRSPMPACSWDALQHASLALPPAAASSSWLDGITAAATEAHAAARCRLQSCGEGTLDALRRLAASERCVAIGECGLDFNRMFS